MCIRDRDEGGKLVTGALGRHRVVSLQCLDRGEIAAIAINIQTKGKLSNERRNFERKYDIVDGRIIFWQLSFQTKRQYKIFC